MPKKVKLKTVYVVTDELYPYYRILKSRSLNDKELVLPLDVVLRYNKSQKEFIKANQALQRELNKFYDSNLEANKNYSYKWTYYKETNK